MDDAWDDEPSGPPLGRLAAFAVATLGLAAAASAWMALAFADRGTGDFRLYRGPGFDEATGKQAGEEDKAAYTGEFLVSAMAPLLVAAVVCAAAVVAWHAAVDRGTRDWGGGLNIDRGQALGGWFVPIANIVLPLKALRELTDVHRSRLAGAALWVWWAPWTVGLVLGAFAFNAAFAWSPFYDGDVDPTPEAMAALDKYGVIVGTGLTVSAVGLAVLVLGLSAAVKANRAAFDEA
ncbi:MAG: DUF4328 domain-containing protein [Sporichthyaceae bacterium]